MKACVLKSKNILEYEEVETPELKEGEVLVKVKGCGICSSDFNRVYGDSAYFYPIILGHEFTGEVVDCSKDITKDYIGKKVVVFPLLPCNECEFCKTKHYAQCKNYSYFGSRCNGAMAEYLAVPEWNIKILPDDMEYSVGALCEPTAVACNVISKIENIPSKSICISGTGTIGILCGLNLLTKGADVTFVVRNDKKIDFLKNLGFKNFIKSDEDKNFDVIVECVGTNSSITNSIKLVKSHGEIILVGNPSSDIFLEKKIYWKILRSELVVKGIWNSIYKGEKIDNWDEAIEFLYNNQKLVSKLITDKFKLSDGISAFEQIKNPEKLSIKGVFENE